MNWNWPKTETNDLVPWYVLGWRIVWLPFYITAACVLVGVAAIAFGRRVAESIWYGISL